MLVRMSRFNPSADARWAAIADARRMSALLPRTVLAASLGLALATLSPGAAGAASIEGDAGLLTFGGAPGEANELVLSGVAAAPARIRFADVGSASITDWPADVCEQVDGDVVCLVPGEVRVE